MEQRSWAALRRAAQLLLTVFLACAATGASAQLPAFPGAEGAGMFAAGGRGGDVYHVTRLDDYPEMGTTPIPGSLRYGIQEVAQDDEINNLTIVFDVGGQIDLMDRLQLKRRHHLTIAGQTAPGDGITLAGNYLEINKSHDVVVRYLRVRSGPNSAEDSIWINESNKVVVDHVSVSWAPDENLSSTKSDDVTVQWSVIAEALNGSPVNPDNVSGHSYGSLINGGNVTYHHNLYAHNRSRNPRPQFRNGVYTWLDFVNNVVYNPLDKFGYGEDDDFMGLNFVGNFDVAGPDTASYNQYVFTSKTDTTVVYQDGNILDLNKDSELSGVSNGWADFRGLNDACTPGSSCIHTQSAVPLDGSNPPPGFPVNTMPLVAGESATDALWSVLNGAGMSLVRDAVDLRIVDEVQTQGGDIPVDMFDVPIVPGQADQWPDLFGGMTRLDTDQDGMPDDYEDSISYLNPNNAADRNLDGNVNGYTDLEDYLHFLVAPIVVPVLAGDYNDDGVVDAADYTKWRDNVGQPAGTLPNDTDGGEIGQLQYNTWVANFGMTASEGGSSALANAAVPEPAGLLLLVCGLGSFAGRRRWRSGDRPS